MTVWLITQRPAPPGWTRERWTDLETGNWCEYDDQIPAPCEVPSDGDGKVPPDARASVEPEDHPPT